MDLLVPEGPMSTTDFQLVQSSLRMPYAKPVRETKWQCNYLKRRKCADTVPFVHRHDSVREVAAEHIKMFLNKGDNTNGRQ